MRFYLQPHAWNNPQLDEAETHHAQRVLRLQPGAAITVFDGEGRQASANIEAFHKNNASLSLGASHITPRPTVALTLAQAIPKGRNMDLIIQKAVELGAARIIPLVTDRTIVRCQHDATKQERWQMIALEACKQCGQNWMPIVESPCSLQESVTRIFHTDLLQQPGIMMNRALASHVHLESRNIYNPASQYSSPLSHPTSQLSPHDQDEISGFNFFQKINANNLHLIASLEKEAMPLKNIFSSLEKNSSSPISSATIFIGPEGDFTPEEYLLVRAAGCHAISLGPIVLRTETAALYCLSVLAYELLR